MNVNTVITAMKEVKNLEKGGQERRDWVVGSIKPYHLVEAVQHWAHSEEVMAAPVTPWLTEYTWYTTASVAIYTSAVLATIWVT